MSKREKYYDYIVNDILNKMSYKLQDDEFAYTPEDNQVLLVKFPFGEFNWSSLKRVDWFESLRMEFSTPHFIEYIAKRYGAKPEEGIEIHDRMTMEVNAVILYMRKRYDLN